MKENEFCPLCGEYVCDYPPQQIFYVIPKGTKRQVKQWYHVKCFYIEKEKIDAQRKEKP